MAALRNIRWGTVLAAVFLVIFAATPAATQGAGEGSVIVTVPDSFPQMEPHRTMKTDAHALILRFPPGGGEDVIVLKSGSVSPEVLAAALDLLRTLRRQEATVRHPQVVTLATYALAPGYPETARERLSARLDELQAQPRVRIGDFGPGKWIRLANARVR